MSKYTEGDWARITKRQKEIFDKFISLMDRDPADPDVQSAVEEWRQHITDNFYDCTPEILRGLGRCMYPIAASLRASTMPSLGWQIS